jgi:hypothetical protein
MIRIASFIEKAGLVDGKRRRLLSPVPLKTSFIPAHYSIDTTSIVHLLLDDVTGFKKYFEGIKGGFKLPGLKGKATVCASLQKLAGKEVTPQDEEKYKDALWTYIAHFKNRRTRSLNPLFVKETTKEGMMQFAHSISTDGYSATLVTTNKDVRCRNRMYKSGVSSRIRKKDNSDDGEEVPLAFRKEFPLLNAQTSKDVICYLSEIGCVDHEKFVGGDPGKGVLLALMDEFRRKVTYSAKQRRHETDGGNRQILKGKKCRGPNFVTRNHKQQRQIIAGAINKRIPGNIVLPGNHSIAGSLPKNIPYVTADILQRELSKRNLTSKTVDLVKFRAYVAIREASRYVYETVYWRKLFRAMRFTSWSKRDASERAFADKIKEKYGRRNGEEGNEQVVILYGNWGRNPNLKHQAPTPGIGLRRMLHMYDGITTITVHEAYTSSFDPKSGLPVSEARGKHALLREDPIPGKRKKRGCFWSRDVLGALNILRKGKHLLVHETPHPLFQG